MIIAPAVLIYRPSPSGFFGLTETVKLYSGLDAAVPSVRATIKRPDNGNLRTLDAGLLRSMALET